MSIKKRILVIGETGSGKSSLIKLLTNDQNIETSDQAIGCTFESKFYEDSEFVFIDTTGLGEDTVPDSDAIRQLINFLRGDKDGFSLMVMVHQKGKIRMVDETNYKLFYGALYQENIPILLVITHCEFDNPIDQWWIDNEKYFVENYKINFVAGISVCTADDDSIQELTPAFRQAVELVREISKMRLIEAFREYSSQNPVPFYDNKWSDSFKRVFRFLHQDTPNRSAVNRSRQWNKIPYESIIIVNVVFIILMAGVIINTWKSSSNDVTLLDNIKDEKIKVFIHTGKVTQLCRTNCKRTVVSNSSVEELCNPAECINGN